MFWLEFRVDRVSQAHQSARMSGLLMAGLSYWLSIASLLGRYFIPMPVEPVIAMGAGASTPLEQEQQQQQLQQ